MATSVMRYSTGGNKSLPPDYDFKYAKIALTAGASPWMQLEELTTLPRPTIAGFEEAASWQGKGKEETRIK